MPHISYANSPPCVCFATTFTKPLVKLSEMVKVTLFVSFLCLSVGSAWGSDHLELHFYNVIHQPLDSATIAESEYDYQAFRIGGIHQEDCEDWYRVASTLLMAEVYGERSLYARSILSDLERYRDLCPMPESTWWKLILGNAYFVSNEFEGAAQAYSQIPKNTENAELYWTYLSAQSNLASAYNALEDIESAIVTLEELDAYINAAETEFEVDDAIEYTFSKQLNINLGGMLVSSRDFAGAEKVFNALDGHVSDAYWLGIIAMNRLIIFQETGAFDQADSLWFSELNALDYAFIPVELTTSILRQSILSEDAVGFKALSSFFAQSSPEWPDNADFPYTQLVEVQQNTDAFQERWEYFVAWEKERANFIRQYINDQQESTAQRINKLTTELEQSDASVERLRSVLGYVLASLTLILVGYFLFRYERMRSSQRALESVLADANNQNSETLELDLDDVRTLGDAITQGKRTADAMLILQKLNLWLMPMRKSKALNVQSLEQYDQLTNSEKKILKEMLAGFGAKEIARLLKVGPAHIYNARSKIRQKLDIPKDMTIDDWVIANAETFDTEGHS